MKNYTTKAFLLFLLTGLLTVTSAITVQAQKSKAYRVSDRTVERLLTRIESGADKYKQSMNIALDRKRFNDASKEDAIRGYIADFENSTDTLSQRFEAKQSVSTDVTMVLNRATAINSFMKENTLTVRSQREWGYLRTDLNTLSSYYNVSFDWNAVNREPVYTKPYRVSDDQIKNVIADIETKTNIYKRRMDNALDYSRLNGTDTEDMLNKYVAEFENSTDNLKNKFNDNKSVTTDVDNLLSRAAFINAFMERNNLRRGAERSWSDIKSDLDILSGYYNVAFDWTKRPVDNTKVAFKVNATQVNSLLTTLQGKTGVFRRDLELALNRSVLNNSRSEEAVNEYIDSFAASTKQLDDNFKANRSTDKDVEDVLNKAAYIDTFMRDYRLARAAERQWLLIKNDLNMLSGFYAVNWNWDRQYNPMTEFDTKLTGTYRLNAALSDDVDRVVENSIRLYPARKEQRVENNLKRRLISPKLIAIEKNKVEISLASSVARKIMFRADGVSREEAAKNGKVVKITSATTYDGVSLNYEGERMNDFYVNFMPLSNGRLKVVRRINLDKLGETVTVASIYDRVNETAQFENLDDGTILNGDTNAKFAIANGTEITAMLKTGEISTSSSRDNDKFTMEITSPSIYEGAIIEGHIVSTKRSGLFTGRANVSLDFDSITLKNGNKYDFAGLIENVQLKNGDKVSVTNEGNVKDDNKTTTTATRTGIGAGVGAILGAILGGGEGAAIGAGVGAGVGAGTVLAQGRDDIKITEGSEFTITATAPANTDEGR